MTTEKKPRSITGKNAVPLIVLGASLLLYLTTLNGWVTMPTLPSVARVLGWEWPRTQLAPLYYLVTLPFAPLPVQFKLLAMNVMAALEAALILGLLARSVQLLPHDRTRDQRHRELSEHSLLTIPLAWLPPVVAVIFCGLQFTFWEHATSPSAEMLDLLLFAYVIRALLEYRISDQEKWLWKSALVYGLGMVNNFAMIGFFPCYIIALVWIRGVSFFNFQFLVRMSLFGLGGLSLYLVVPALSAVSGNGSFFEALKIHMGYQKTMLTIPVVRFWILLFSFASIIPLTLASIRWPSFHGEHNPIGHSIGLVLFRLVHTFFLGFCVWFFFDPEKLSPRHLGRGVMHFLPFYYLSAICVGYYSGYFLLVFGKEPAKAWERSSRSIRQLKLFAVYLVVAGLFAGIAYLTFLNVPKIRLANGKILKELAGLMVSSLPEKCVVVSDESAILQLLRAAPKLGSQRLLLDTVYLTRGKYIEHLRQEFPEHATTLNHTNFSSARIDPNDLLDLLVTFSQTTPLFYAHPSFGYYFERFYLRPQGPLYAMKLYPEMTLMPPELTPDEIAFNEKFWDASYSSFRYKGIEDVQSVKFANGIYSRSLNYWGVEQQKRKELGKASRAFEESMLLNPDNVVAQINLEFNAHLTEGSAAGVAKSEALDKKLGRFRSLEAAMRLNGPFDEIEFCLQVGSIMARGQNLRQAALLFSRVIQLDNRNVEAKVALVKTFIDLQAQVVALSLIDDVQKQMAETKANPDLLLELINLRALAFWTSGDLDSAEKVLSEAYKNYPDEPRHFNQLLQFYERTTQFPKALVMVEEQLVKKPQNLNLMLAKGTLLIRSGDFEKAFPVLDSVLIAQPDNIGALTYRAIARLQLGKLDEAKSDYETVQRLSPNQYYVLYGLGEIARKKEDPDNAIKYFQLYLKHAPGGTEESRRVEDRLQELSKGK